MNEWDFIKSLKSIKNYWTSLPDKTTDEVVDGVLFSVLVMFDGDSSVNDFHPLNIVDTHDGSVIDGGCLHEIYCSERRNK